MEEFEHKQKSPFEGRFRGMLIHPCNPPEINSEQDPQGDNYLLKDLLK